MKKWVVEVPVTVIVSVVVKAEDESEAGEAFGGIDDLIYIDSMGGISPNEGATLYFDADCVNWARIAVSPARDTDEAINEDDEAGEDEW